MTLVSSPEYIVDGVALVLVAAMVVRSAAAGWNALVVEVGGLTLGLVSALLLFDPGVRALDGFLGVDQWPAAVVFGAVFFVTYVGVKSCEQLLLRRLGTIAHRTVDRLLGACLGFVNAVDWLVFAAFVVYESGNAGWRTVAFAGRVGRLVWPILEVLGGIW